jgi:hypothetical protein
MFLIMKKDISKNLYILIFTFSIITNISVGQNKLLTLSIDKKSFFELNNEKHIISNDINNRKASSVSNESFARVNIDSFFEYNCRNFEEIGNDIIKIDNWYISKSTKKGIDLGINLKIQDSLIYTGKSLINPFDGKVNIRTSLNLLGKNNNIGLKKIDIGPSTIIEIYNHSIGEKTYLYDILNDTIKYIGKKKSNVKSSRTLFIDENDNYIKENFASTFQNNNSKYFLLGRNLLINRYNLNEIIEIDDLKIISNNENINNGVLYYYDSYPINPLCLTFNDSLMIFSVAKSELDKNFNSKSKNNVKNDAISFLSKNISISDFKNKIEGELNIFKIEENNEINKTIYKNLLPKERSCAVVYNYKTKSILGVLSRAIIPFSLIDNIIIDKTNQLIIINSDKYFTIFDSNNFKEIITIKGNAKSIDHNNNLIIDPIIQIKNKQEKNEEFRITYTKYSLNELINKNNYYQEPIRYKDIDEFTTKKEFLSQLEYHYKNNLLHFIEKNKITGSKINYNNKNENNNKIITTNILLNRLGNIETELKKKFNNPESNYPTKEMIFIYKTYEQNNNNKLVFTCNDDFDHPFSDIDLSKIKSNFNNIIPATAVLKISIGIDQIPRIEINNIDPFKAKILKDYKLIFSFKENPKTTELSLLNYLIEKYPQIIEPLFGIDKEGMHEDSEINRNLKRIFEYTLSIRK